MNKEELEKKVSLLPKNTSLSNLEKVNLKALFRHGSDQGLDCPMTSYIAKLDFRRFLESGLRFFPEKESMYLVVSSVEEHGLLF